MSDKRGSDLAVPDITEDAAERKRILNVLAQRRYRKRKKDRLQTLQRQVQRQADKASLTVGSSNLGTLQSSTVEETSPAFGHNTGPPLQDSDDSLLKDTLSDPIPTIHQSPDPLFFCLLSAPDSFIPQFSDDNPFIIPSPPAFISSDSSGKDPNPQCQSLSWPNPASTHLTNTSTPTLSDCLQTSESSIFTFPDDTLLEVPRVKLLNAAMQVALRLGVADMLWDLTAISPFYKGNPAGRDTCLALTSSSLPSTSQETGPNTEPQYTSLPRHLRPTKSQLLLPHHPMLDILPWPSTRDKLIQIFNFPPHLRPAAARDPMGLLGFAYDMEDEGGEGIRVANGDVFEPDGWEIGQLVFERWWWAFEGGVVERCDRARRGRGEGGLVLGVVG
ncbi:uncharacterized protein BDV14DRAFT_199039 [Aspergillus stella-maris]|uniref:uncharacterized protein n=1 Tax=Aspergillus stella-maris TaxID=1810926 RepID=UPI003CCD411D